VNLLGERRLSDPYPRRGAPEMQFLRHRYEVAKLSQIHT
jgi:hypothetical protein